MVDRLPKVLLGIALSVALAAPTLAAPRPAAPRPAASADLTGVWTNAWYTYLRRPKAFKALVASPAEAEAYEAPRRALHGEIVEKDDVLGQAETEFPDNGPGLARIRGEIRTSWLVDPEDGKLPWSKAGRARLKAEGPNDDDYDNIERRDPEERCLTGSGGTPPILNTHDANVVQIVQTPGWVVIVTEKNQMTRIVPIVGARGPRPEQRTEPGTVTGASVGHWEGKTLVVETFGLRNGLTKISDELYLSGSAHVVERFTRTGPGEITYTFAVADPGLFTRAWRAEMVFRAEPKPRFEYACHEGNYSLPSILAAARASETASGAPGAVAAGQTP